MFVMLIVIVELNWVVKVEIGLRVVIFFLIVCIIV